MFARVSLILSVYLSGALFCKAQPELLPIPKTDSNFVRKHLRPNEIRCFYGLQGNNLSLGTTRNGAENFNGDLYTNTNDYIGFGLSYKWFDGEASFSLPGTTYLNQERSTLNQYKLVAGYSTRKLAFRGYLLDNKGVVLTGTENEFYSSPSLHEVRVGLQVTYIFNSTRFSYRANLYQSEYQENTAGSFLFRIEPFYRELGSKGERILPEPYTLRPEFGDQVGLVYIKAPGFLLLPGYGFNFVIPNSRLFISPMVFAGCGPAFNVYKANEDKYRIRNMEYAAYFNLNMGYNGSRYYSKLEFNWTAGYDPINPSYLTSNHLTLSLWVGIRFSDLR